MQSGFYRRISLALGAALIGLWPRLSGARMNGGAAIQLISLVSAFLFVAMTAPPVAQFQDILNWIPAIAPLPPGVDGLSLPMVR
jgi:NADH:ubiquinone oxidoreductase subunit 4 (subunit M)